MMNAYPAVLLFASLTLTGCLSAGDHLPQIDEADTTRLTVGLVQRSIEVGADTAQVLAALGSPNIVSTDADRNEVWVYDRVNTIKQRSSSESGLLGAGAASIGSLLVGVAPAHNQRSGASISSQRTLTVIIHFDGTGRVRDYSYHASRF